MGPSPGPYHRSTEKYEFSRAFPLLQIHVICLFCTCLSWPRSLMPSSDSHTATEENKFSRALPHHRSTFDYADLSRPDRHGKIRIFSSASPPFLQFNGKQYSSTRFARAPVRRSTVTETGHIIATTETPNQV